MLTAVDVPIKVQTTAVVDGAAQNELVKSVVAPALPNPNSALGGAVRNGTGKVIVMVGLAEPAAPVIVKLPA
jgi:hypothetical protein